MHPCFFAIYLFLGVLFNFIGLLCLYAIYEHDPQKTPVDIHYYIDGVYTILNGLLFVAGFTIICILVDGSASTKKCMATLLYIFAALFAIVDITLGVMFEKTISRVYKEKSMGLYLLYSALYLSLCFCRTIVTTLFCLVAARELLDDLNTKYTPIQYY